jgi:acetyl esterase/lipase
VILYLHGGGYVSCSPAVYRPITAALARLTPARVFALDYRLAPEHPHPAAVDDAERAFDWLLAQGVGPETIAVAGDSAGGGLTLALLLRLRDKGKALPAAAVLLSPWTDLSGSGPSMALNDGRDAMFRPANIRTFAGCYAPMESWRVPAVSPVFGDLGGLPPVHLQVGAEELLRDDAVRVHDRIERAGGSSELALFEGVFHGWHLLDGVIPESRRALEQASQFARARAAAIAPVNHSP